MYKQISFTKEGEFHELYQSIRRQIPEAFSINLKTAL